MPGLGGFESELVAAIERLRPSVVRIRRTGPLRPEPDAPESEAAGTGIVLDPRGHVVTNAHVVRGAREIVVTAEDGRERPAELIGHDVATDLAVLRVEGRSLLPAELADSEQLRVGQFAVAIGNSLGLPGGPTVSVGVVSALGRPLPGADHVLEGLLQTDAAINPGNSGGPLADLAGRVIGVNSAMVPFAQGVGFAIPSNTVRQISEELLGAGRVLRPWLGISGAALTPSLARRVGSSRTSGVLLAEIYRLGPASNAGLRPGDVLFELGGRPIATLRDLLSTLGGLPIGGAVPYRVERDGRVRRGVLRPAEAPAPLEPAA
jgi:serine protease Do